MISKETAYQQIQALVKRFEEQIESYRSCDHNETLTRRDSIISLVDFMLQLNREMSSAVIPEIKEQIKARLNYTDQKINAMVYQLYGLKPEEIAMVENFR